MIMPRSEHMQLSYPRFREAADGDTFAGCHQLRELTAVADRSGWEIWKVCDTPGSAARRAGTNVRGSTPC
jgi:hypothetical protein